MVLCACVVCWCLSVYVIYDGVKSASSEYDYAGCLQLLENLEIYWNLKTLLEISWNLIGPPGNFFVRCRRSTALVSSHKTGYQIAYLRNWSSYFIFAMAPCCIKCISYFCSISRQTTSTDAPLNSNRFGTLHRRPKQGKHVLDFS